MTTTTPEEREIVIPAWAVLLLLAVLLAVGFISGMAVRTWLDTGGSHPVSCTVSGGPSCTRDAVLDPASAN